MPGKAAGSTEMLAFREKCLTALQRGVCPFWSSISVFVPYQFTILPVSSRNGQNRNRYHRYSPSKRRRRPSRRKALNPTKSEPLPRRKHVMLVHSPGATFPNGTSPGTSATDDAKGKHNPLYFKRLPIVVWDGCSVYQMVAPFSPEAVVSTPRLAPRLLRIRSVLHCGANPMKRAVLSRQIVGRITPFHGGNMGSNPVGDAKNSMV